MKLLAWNVNGIRAVVRKGFTDFLQEQQPDLLALQEIKIADAARLQTDFDFQNYYEYWHAAQRPGYSGTALLCKRKPLAVVNGFGHSAFDDEGRSQTLELPDFYVVNVYFPNTQAQLTRLDFKQEFNRRFLRYLQGLDRKKPVIVCGDFNVAPQEIDLKNPDANRGHAGFTDEERQWFARFLQAGFVDTFRELQPQTVQYSWWTYRFGARQRNIGWRIDMFLVSRRLLPRVRRAYILDQVQGSDHAPIGLELK